MQRKGQEMQAEASPENLRRMEQWMALPNHFDSEQWINNQDKQNQDKCQSGLGLSHNYFNNISYMSLRIAWASESGNSADLLREFIDHCRKQAISIAGIQESNERIKLSRGIWVFFVSTTGQGSPPYSMRPFWKELMKKNYKLESGIAFSIYSLGDSSYGEHFGMTARKLRQRLKMLGAEQFAQIGLGDDMDPQGYRQVYLKRWRDEVTSFIKKNAVHQIQQIGAFERISLRREQDELEFHIQQAEELSSHKNRRVSWVKLHLKSETTTVKEGDIVEIYPHNRAEDIEFMLSHFNKDGTQLILYKNREITLRQLLTQHLNISYVVNYYFFVNNSVQQLIQSTSNPLFQQKIRQFSTNYEEYFNFIRRYKRNVIEFIRDFELQLNFQYFLSNINEIIGRKYSIAKVEGKCIYLLVKLVEDQITEGRFYRGLCSNDLHKHKGESRKGRILSGEITPKQLRANNIIITLGTGIAPFVWILDQIQRQNYQCLLIYTNSFHDEIFHRQLVALKENQNYGEVVSLTRQGGLKIIRLLESQAPRIYESIAKNGAGKTRIFYCGPKQVHEYFLVFLSKLLGVQQSQIKKSKLLIYENW